MFLNENMDQCQRYHFFPYQFREFANIKTQQSRLLLSFTEMF